MILTDTKKVVNSGNHTIPLTVDLDTTYTGVNGTILVGYLSDSDVLQEAYI